MSIKTRFKERWEAVPTKRRQYLFLAIVCFSLFALLWAVLALPSGDPKPAKPAVSQNKDAQTTNVLAPGNVSPLDEWVGTAGRRLAEFEKERGVQSKKLEEVEDDRKRFQDQVMKRLGELEQPRAQGSGPVSPAQPAASGSEPPPGIPPGTPPAMGPTSPVTPVPPAAQAEDAVAPLGRVSLGSTATLAPEAATKAASSTTNDRSPVKGSTGTFLPVGFVRGILIGGIDAPTGGQSQSNPQPVLIRLTDNAFLPNRFRGRVKECLVVGAGYGDISSERAYVRTVSLSCVRHDGQVLEVDLKGNVFGEDGKLGVRGRLVTKQGQLLANALRAGIVGGIGQGFSNAGTTVSTGAFGSVTSSSAESQQQMKNGVMGGFGRALDRLADYYVRLAEQTFPIIEIDAAREVDVAITRGVMLPIGLADETDPDAVQQPGGRP